jgi:hypothetical protein
MNALDFIREEERRVEAFSEDASIKMSTLKLLQMIRFATNKGSTLTGEQQVHLTETVRECVELEKVNRLKKVNRLTATQIAQWINSCAS